MFTSWQERNTSPWHTIRLKGEVFGFFWRMEGRREKRGYSRECSYSRACLVSVVMFAPIYLFLSECVVIIFSLLGISRRCGDQFCMWLGPTNPCHASCSTTGKKWLVASTLSYSVVPADRSLDASVYIKERSLFTSLRHRLHSVDCVIRVVLFCLDAKFRRGQN